MPTIEYVIPPGAALATIGLSSLWGIHTGQWRPFIVILLAWITLAAYLGILVLCETRKKRATARSSPTTTTSA